jgi:hypothetical protein
MASFTNSPLPISVAILKEPSQSRGEPSHHLISETALQMPGWRTIAVDYMGDSRRYDLTETGKLRAKLPRHPPRDRSLMWMKLATAVAIRQTECPIDSAFSFGSQPGGFSPLSSDEFWEIVDLTGATFSE